MKKVFIYLIISFFTALEVFSQSSFNGLDLNMGNLYKLSNAKTRSISPENLTGEKGKGGMANPEDKDIPNKANAYNAARDLGQGWKVNPYVKIKPGETFTMAEIDGSGAIQHIWMTPTGNWRYSILRIYWDGETEPSVECPVGIFSAWAGINMHRLTHLPYVLTREVRLTATGQCLSGRNAG